MLDGDRGSTYALSSYRLRTSSHPPAWASGLLVLVAICDAGSGGARHVVRARHDRRRILRPSSWIRSLPASDCLSYFEIRRAIGPVVFRFAGDIARWGGRDVCRGGIAERKLTAVRAETDPRMPR